MPDLNTPDARNNQSVGNSAKLHLAFSTGPFSNTELKPETLTWEDFVSLLQKPAEGPKDGSYLIRGGDLIEPRRGDKNLRSAEIFIIDGEQGFNAETGELLTGVDPDTGETKNSAPPIEVARDALARLGYQFVIHQTHSAVPGEINRWRAFIPAQMRNAAELEAVAEYVTAQLQAENCFVEAVKEMKTFSQAWALPRCKRQHLADYKCFSNNQGRAVDVAAAVAFAKAQKEATTARERYEAAPQPERSASGPSPIESFNASATLEGVRKMLEQAGYRFAYRRGEELRFIAPGSETRTAGVHVFKGRQRGDIVVYSHHGGHDPLSGRLNDAFGVLTRVTHKGNQEAAIAEAKVAVNWKGREPGLEGFGVEDNCGAEGNGENENPRGLEVFSFLDLMRDETPDAPDYIQPDFLGEGNFCLIAGPPKAQKSFLLAEMLVACATGGTFLGGTFSVPRPLKVFYLQAEMNKKLLRKRAKMMGEISEGAARLLDENLAVTSRFSMTLNPAGVGLAIQTIKKRFPDGGPDIIAIDPLANLFDGDSEDRAPEMMAFLTGRIEPIRRAVNPKAAIVLVHHSGKKSAEDMGRDPFVAIRGSGALRGYYDTGLVIYRKGEDGPERRVHFELRNGDSPEPMTVKLDDFGRFRSIDPNAVPSVITMGIARQMLDEINERWKSGKPLSLSNQTRRQARYASFELSRKFDVPAKEVDALLMDWQRNGIIEEREVNTHSKLKGLKKLQNI